MRENGEYSAGSTRISFVEYLRADLPSTKTDESDLVEMTVGCFISEEAEGELNGMSLGQHRLTSAGNGGPI